MSAEKEWHSPQFRMNFLLQSHRSTRFQSGKDKIPSKLLNLCTVTRSADTNASFLSMHFGKVAVATKLQLSLIVFACFLRYRSLRNDGLPPRTPALFSAAPLSQTFRAQG